MKKFLDYSTLLLNPFFLGLNLFLALNGNNKSLHIALAFVSLVGSIFSYQAIRIKKQTEKLELFLEDLKNDNRQI